MQLKGARTSINISSCIILFSCCHRFNNFAVKFTILLLCVVDVLLSLSISSLDMHLHSLPWTGAELNYSATLPGNLVAGGAGWKHQSQRLPGWAAAHSLIPAEKLPLPGTHGLDAAAWCWGRLPVLAERKRKAGLKRHWKELTFLLWVRSCKYFYETQENNWINILSC